MTDEATPRTAVGVLLDKWEHERAVRRGAAIEAYAYGVGDEPGDVANVGVELHRYEARRQLVAALAESDAEARVFHRAAVHALAARAFHQLARRASRLGLDEAVT